MTDAYWISLADYCRGKEWGSFRHFLHDCQQRRTNGLQHLKAVAFRDGKWWVKQPHFDAWRQAVAKRNKRISRAR